MAIYICFTLTWRFSLFTITGLDFSYVQNWLENKLAPWFAFILHQWFPCQIGSLWKIWPRAGFVYYLFLQAKASSVCWPKPLTCMSSDILLPGNGNTGITMHSVLSVGEGWGKLCATQPGALVYRVWKELLWARWSQPGTCRQLPAPIPALQGRGPGFGDVLSGSKRACC